MHEVVEPPDEWYRSGPARMDVPMKCSDSECGQEWEASCVWETGKYWPEDGQDYCPKCECDGEFIDG